MLRVQRQAPKQANPRTAGFTKYRHGDSKALALARKIVCDENEHRLRTRAGYRSRGMGLRGGRSPEKPTAQKPTLPTVDSLEQTTYSLARAALEEQERTLGELRQRTGMVLTAASIAASFFGAQALAHHALSLVVTLGLLAFIVCLFASVYVIAPKKGLRFAIDARVAYESLFGEDIAEALRTLTYWLEATRETNVEAVDQHADVFLWACGALIAEIVLLAAGLAQ